MKRFFSLIVWLVFPALLFAQHNMDSLFSILDKTVDNNQVYVSQKEKKLDKLQSLLKDCSSENRKFEIFGQLYNEYNSYKSDSALKYAREQLKIAEHLNDSYKLNNSRLNLAFMLSVIGMYKESLDMLQTVDKNLVSGTKSRYFVICQSIYNNMADYATSQEKNRYGLQIKACRDSLLALNQRGTHDYIIAQLGALSAEKKYDEALKLLFSYYPTIQSNIRKKANVAFLISYLYNVKKDREQEKYWLAISAINDLQSTNKEYISLRSMAFMLYQDGDVARAYRYIKQSMEDALFCNARLRTVEIAQILPIIDKAYQAETEAHQKQLVISLICISLLSAFLIIAIFFVYRQMKKLSVARKELSGANEKLNTLNEELFATNAQLKNTNQTLLETNLIKEEYIGRYMDQCSVYIDKLDNYRRQLNKTAVAGKIDDLLSTLKSKQFIDDELKEFYNNFDTTFLQLFPTFVKDFTALLADDEHIQLKPGQLLNTELRIFALMRLGIDDGVKMSQFLRCSLSTIYNYSAKIRSKAKDSRDEFEKKVMQIGFSVG